MDSRLDRSQQQTLGAMEVNHIRGCISKIKGSGLRGMIVLYDQHARRLIWNTESGFQVTSPHPCQKRQTGKSPESDHHDGYKIQREAERGRLVSLAEGKATGSWEQHNLIEVFHCLKMMGQSAPPEFVDDTRLGGVVNMPDGHGPQQAGEMEKQEPQEIQIKGNVKSYTWEGITTCTTKKANSTLGCVRKNIASRSRKTHPECCVQFWASSPRDTWTYWSEYSRRPQRLLTVWSI
ncbi:hypothetical protein QYF61_007307 [Mycteria americana]|uniref:Uncharacterized protein n=1 Tax=Mycteria americana TaxID=33587 RepID=A0AAN7N1U4_MYCAM|nr:hypothetical protein QYF61_007307 [Mycteria americana]